MAVQMTKAEIFSGAHPLFNFSRDSKALEKLHADNSEPFSFILNGRRMIGRCYTLAASGKTYIVEHTGSNGPTFYTFNTLRAGQVVPMSQDIEIVDKG